MYKVIIANIWKCIKQQILKTYADDIHLYLSGSRILFSWWVMKLAAAANQIKRSSH